MMRSTDHRVSALLGWLIGRRPLIAFGSIGLVTIVLITVGISNLTVAAQQITQWPPKQRIPDFHPETWPPFLIADQNRTVHAFSSQWSTTDEGASVQAIMYNQWTLEGGWTPPIDILLSPLKNSAWIGGGAYLDQSGMMHIAFFGGDETEANIYYSRAPALRAGQAPAWSKPDLVGEAASSPAVVALVGDDEGNLAIVYSGRKEGWGLYTTYSTDGGDTWTEPAPTFLTYDELFPFILKLSRGPSGLIHAVWDVRDVGGNGRQINYASLNIRDRQWSEPVALAEVQTGYGVLIPTVVEYQGDVIVAYSGVTIRRSSDGGRTWTEPLSPFRQVGVNGTMSFVVDSNDNLHLLWAQRITGSPDIHGVWHSVWQGGDRWSVPEAVFSNPRIVDELGDKYFDPYEVRAVASQGNVLLVTFREDPGAGNSGVWYSYTTLNTPELPVVPVPSPSPTPVPLPAPTVTPPVPVATISHWPLPITQEEPPMEAATNPSKPLMLGVVPVFLLIVGVIVVRQLNYIRR
jgi:hypothetical protein